MAIITNEDLEIMCEVEHLLHKKLEQTNGIKDTFKGEEYYYFNENDKEYEIWVKYWNMVEKFCQAKDKSRKKARDFNKNNAEYHRLSNNLYSARKRNDKDRIELYTKKIKEYKEKQNKIRLLKEMI